MSIIFSSFSFVLSDPEGIPYESAEWPLGVPGGYTFMDIIRENKRDDNGIRMKIREDVMKKKRKLPYIVAVIAMMLLIIVILLTSFQIAIFGVRNFL